MHVIQALLGHATIDTVMVYAKLYPQTLVEEYRKAVRGLYIASHGEESRRNPTTEEWKAFSANCSMRDMGTYICALPTGEHCPRDLGCLGCTHAPPKKSSAPIFRRMLASHERELAAAKVRSEPLGQIAAREIEVARIRGALERAEEFGGRRRRSYRGSVTKKGWNAGSAVIERKSHRLAGLNCGRIGASVTYEPGHFYHPGRDPPRPEGDAG
jgi:hypothetical protein